VPKLSAYNSSFFTPDLISVFLSYSRPLCCTEQYSNLKANVIPKHLSFVESFRSSFYATYFSAIVFSLHSTNFETFNTTHFITQ
jgi:hypothetical protein